METTRVTIFAAMLFAIAFSTGIFSFSLHLQNHKAKITASLISITILIFSIITGNLTSEIINPTFAQAGCFFLLSVSAIRRVFEMRTISRHNSASLKTAISFTATDAAVAGFGAGLGGINFLAVLIICITLHTTFISFAKKDENNHPPLPLLGAILFFSLAVLL